MAWREIDRDTEREREKEKVPNRSRPAFHRLGKKFVKKKKKKKSGKERKRQVQFLNCTFSVIFQTYVW